MKLRFRQQFDENTEPPANTAGVGPAIAALRTPTQSLVTAADEAITRVLSKNSLEFLEQHRQAGGE